MKTVTITPKGPRLLTKISSAIRILSHRNARPIYIGALQHIALRRVFRRGNKKDYEES